MSFLLSLLEILLLFFLSQTLTKTLSQVFYKWFGSQKIVIHILSFLFLPGVVVHELAHLLVANICMVPTGEVEFFPEIHGNEVKMGSVAIARTDPARRFVIGVAPIAVGLFMLIIAFWYVGSAISLSWQTLLLLYIVFQVSNTMFSSKKDMEGALGVLAVAVVLLLLAFIAKLPVVAWGQFFLSNAYLEQFLASLNTYVLIAIAMDIVVILMGKGVLRIRRR